MNAMVHGGLKLWIVTNADAQNYVKLRESLMTAIQGATFTKPSDDY